MMVVLDEDQHPPGMPDWQLLYVCTSCGMPLCESVFVEILVEEHCVRWTRFYRRHGDRKLYRSVGPFVFDGTQYAGALWDCYYAGEEE